MRYSLAILLCLASFQTHAERIRDHSLSPEESMRVPDNIDSNATQQYLQQPAGGDFRDARPRYNNTRQGAYQTSQQPPQKRLFMEEYCQPSIQPIVKSHSFRGLVDCLKSVKDKACDSFARLPDEAKTLVDNTTSCVYQAAQAGTSTSYDIQCRQHYAEQMWLLKKYWGEASTAYTILFLPDMLVDSASFCQNGRR